MPGTRTALAFAIFLIGAQAHAQDAAQAQQLLRQGQAAQAVQVYSRLIQASPGDADLWLGRGLAHARQAQWKEASENLEKAAELAPDYADVWAALADVYRWSNQPAAAAQAHERLARLRPQTPPPELLRDPIAANGSTWLLSVGEAQTRNTTGNAQERTLSLRRYGALGSIALEQLTLRRFGIDDVAYAIDAYPRLWTGAYANVRLQSAASPQLYPRDAWRIELYQSLGDGWEIAASRDELGFNSRVRIDGLSLGRYWGNFFARWRRQQVSSDVSSGDGDRVFVRYYYRGEADHYMELNATRGRSDDFSTAVLQPARTDSQGLVWYHFVTRDWGLRAAWSESRSSSTDNREHNLGLGLMARW